MYHRLGSGALSGREEGEEVYAVTPETFESHLGTLASSGCRVVPFGTLVSDPAGPEMPPRSVAITFDDGNASDHSEALPALLRHGYRAAFFVTPAWVGTRGYMDWSQIRELAAAGMTVGAHGFDHARLATLPESDLIWQLREARRVMEAELGHAPDILSLPGGSGGPRVVAVAKEQGFTCVVGSVPRCRVAGDDPLPRFALRRGDSLRGFRALVEQRPFALLRRSLRHQVLSGLRGALGEGLYRRVRRVWAKEA